LSFKTASTIDATNSKIEIAIGEAYNSSRSPVSIVGESGNVEFKKTTTTTKTFYLNSNSTKTELGLNETTQITVFNSNYYSFSGADFILEYDPAFFEVVSVNLAGALLKEGSFYSCNTDINGLVKISFASSNEIYTSELFTVELKMINESEFSDYTDVIYSCQNVANSKLSVYQSFQSVTTLKLKGTCGSIYIESTDFVKNMTAQSTVKLSADSFVAAGDFVINYDEYYIKPISVKMNNNATADGGMLIINPNYQNGVIKFSYVNENGVKKAVSLIDIVWEVLTSGEHTTLIPTSTSLVDSDLKELDLRYISSDECVYEYNVTDINPQTHPHRVVAKCNKCNAEITTVVSAIGCAQCEFTTKSYVVGNVLLEKYNGTASKLTIPGNIMVKK
jgi:hypothetical protein